MTYRLIDAEEIEKALLWLSKYWDRPTHPEYYHAKTVDEAVSLLNEYKEEAKIVAGGIDLVGLMKNKVLLKLVVTLYTPASQIRLSWHPIASMGIRFAQI